MGKSGLEKLGDDLHLNRGISDKQIGQLIHYANTDLLVKRFTHDFTRFKNRQAFDQWLSVKPKIYTLTDSKKNLLGIIWFEKLLLESPKCQTTFAIRLYGKARGRGLGWKFMEMVFNDYLKTKKDKQIWLKTSVDNYSAIRLYEKFGFRKITPSDAENKIVMLYRPR